MTDQIKIKIGVIGSNPAWTLLLNQIGVDWQSVDDSASVSPASFSLLIVATRNESFSELNIIEFAKAGGVVLFSKKSTTRILSAVRKKEYRTSIQPQIHAEYSFYDLFDLYDDVFLFENDSFVKTEKVGSGIISYLGIDIDKIFAANASCRKSFYAPTDRLPHERVARRSKNAARQFIQSHLEFLHHQRALPFIHKWYYPKNNASLFTFRIDSDKGTKEQIEEIYQLSEKHQIPTTWFLDVKSHEQWLEYFKKFTKQELGVHCYEHAVFNSALLNQENFEKAKSLLHRSQLQAHGIAAPTGAWNNAIGKAIQALNFDFSSEFCYDYDNLPSYPFVDSRFSSAVQFPIHPVCIGIMIREHMSAESMIRYYKETIDRKLALREPICLYHHPTHKHNEVFEEVFRYINSKNILKLSYSEYAAWWKRRENFKFGATFNGSAIMFDADSEADSWVRISMPNKMEIITEPKTTLQLASELFTHATSHVNIPSDILRARKFNLRHSIQNFLDWWIKTTE